MDLTELTAFVAVAKHNSFSKASDVLYITQPAVSKRISRLESSLNCRLFDRIGKQVSLTEAGRLLLEPAKKMLIDSQNIKHLLSTLSDEVKGDLVMGTSHHVGLHRLPDTLREFKQKYPMVNLDIRFMDSEQACRLVENGELELAIVTLPAVPSPSLLTQKVWQDEMCFVVDENHDLVKLDGVSIKTILSYPAVLPASGTYTRSLLEKAIEPENLKLNIRMSTNYLETLKMLVSIGVGWSIIPRIMLDEQLREVKTELNLLRDLGVVLHCTKTLSNAAKAMLGLLS